MDYTKVEIKFDPLEEDAFDGVIDLLCNTCTEEVVRVNGKNKVYVGDMLKVTIKVEYKPEDK